MRVLAISDIHGEVDRLAALSALFGEADLILIAGDLTDFGGREELEGILDLLGPARAAGKLAVVPGNCDRRAAREFLEEEGISADGHLLDKGGALIAGSGGGLLHSGLTPYERRDEDLGASLAAVIASQPRTGDHGRPLIVLSHTPPHGTGADRRRGSSLGSRQLRKVLDSETPPLWVCGHIHESRSAALSGPTLVVNPGPLRDGCYALIELERKGQGTWAAKAELPAC
ncbi:MAG TPA: metallophosphoesterase [Rectinemataceae bacterium]|nr:metallophosphoesterase [Rectinemataceae bacterium]